jgi:hypothetical protein
LKFKMPVLVLRKHAEVLIRTFRLASTDTSLTQRIHQIRIRLGYVFKTIILIRILLPRYGYPYS